MPWYFTNDWVSYQGNKTMYQSNIMYLFYSIGTMTEKAADIYATGPAKKCHVGSQNLTSQTFVTHNFFTPIWYGHTIFRDCA